MAGNASQAELLSMNLRYGLGADGFGVKDVDEGQGSAFQIVVELTLLIDDQFAGGEEESGAFGCVGIVDVELADGEVVGRGGGIGMGFAELQGAVGDEGDPAAGGRDHRLDEGDVVTRGSGDGTATDSFRFGERGDQGLVVPILKCAGKSVEVRWSGICVDGECDADRAAGLGVGGLDGLRVGGETESCSERERAPEKDVGDSGVADGSDCVGEDSHFVILQ